MRALARPALCVQLLLLSAGAGAFCVTPLSHRGVRCLATERQALGMNAGADSPIPELAALYEVMPLMTYDGWECDAEIVEDLWVSGRTSESIKRRVEQMRRKQCLHEGDRSDALLQVLDGATQGFTYRGWELDREMEEDSWVDGFVTAASIKERVRWSRSGADAPKACLHDFHEKYPTMKPPAIPTFLFCSFLATWCFMCFYVWDTHTVPPIFSFLEGRYSIRTTPLIISLPRPW